MEIFLGVEAIAGLCCIISEVLMIISIYMFEKEEDTTSTIKDEKVTVLSHKSGEVEISTKSGESLGHQEEKSVSWFFKPTLSATVHHLHALVVTVLVVNMQHLPFVGILPVFFTAGMGVKETLIHWFAACTSIGLYTLAFAYFKARYNAIQCKIMQYTTFHLKVFNSYDLFSATTSIIVTV